MVTLLGGILLGRGVGFLFEGWDGCVCAWLHWGSLGVVPTMGLGGRRFDHAVGLLYVTVLDANGTTYQISHTQSFVAGFC